MPYIMILDANCGGGSVLHVGTTASLGKGDSSSGGGGDGDRTAKAQARRAQVRKAQIQHRQRKANYTKQLEMDIAKLRDDITRTEGESTALRDENDEIRKRLTKTGVAIPKPKSPALRQNLQQLPPAPPTQTQSVLMTTKEMSTRATPFSIPGNSPDSQPSASALATSSDHYIVSLDISDSNTPAYHIYRTSSPSSGASYRSPADNKSAAEGSSYGEGGEPNLSDRSEFTNEQTDYAINFILGYVASKLFLIPSMFSSIPLFSRILLFLRSMKRVRCISREQFRWLAGFRLDLFTDHVRA